ncbi:MAG TPA: ATP-binding protein [Candidatus Omnitrophota bacterium]|nr:ATP-binding protein [Candidatus Omnitrophota bacterium]HRY85828.1 ATP-binding protein [Candidatus Omnitrophota bacterium]
MSEKLDFIKKIKSRLPQIEKDSLYLKLLEGAAENQLLEEACQNLEEGIAITDAKGHLRFINRKAEDWLGNSHIIANRPLWSQVQDPSLASFLRENLASVKTRTVHDLKILSPREAQLRITIFPQEQDEKKYFVVILADITSRTEQEFETVMLARMESLIRLAGGIAHEIGNPLNAITIHLELLKKRLAGLPELKRRELADSLSDIQDETRRLDRIIRNFLKATRKPPLRFQLNDLNDVVADALAFLKPQLDVAKIQIKLTRDKAIPAFLMDRERLYYAFMNLIKNALEAMPKGGTLKVQVSHKQHCAIVAVTDTGHGIPEEHLDKIFDIYYTTKKEGAGLGLMMVYDAIAEHGGKIEVVSKLNKGTTFKILLPVREPQLQLPDYHAVKGG